MKDETCISDAALSLMMPMHLRVDSAGRILRCGPTIAKIFPDGDLQGRSFFKRFQILRPGGIETVDGLRGMAGNKLHLRPQNGHETRLKAVGVALRDGGILLDLSFGISVVDAIRCYDLTISDFAATDLAVEMLYLLEAKSAAMNESRKLNMRLQGARIAAEEQAFTDRLTGLKNRRAMDHVLSRYTETGESFGLMQVDLDYFKTVNDTLGHAAGDHVLLQVAGILLDETRKDDLVVRVGGDEFVLVFHQMTDIAKLNEVAARIIARLEEPIYYNGKQCRISASIGTTISDYYQTPDIDRMLEDADLALYASKNRGRAQFTVYSQELVQQPAQPGR